MGAVVGSRSRVGAGVRFCFWVGAVVGYSVRVGAMRLGLASPSRLGAMRPGLRGRCLCAGRLSGLLFTSRPRRCLGGLRSSSSRLVGSLLVGSLLVSSILVRSLLVRTTLAPPGVMGPARLRPPHRLWRRRIRSRTRLSPAAERTPTAGLGPARRLTRRERRPRFQVLLPILLPILRLILGLILRPQLRLKIRLPTRPRAVIRRGGVAVQTSGRGPVGSGTRPPLLRPPRPRTLRTQTLHVTPTDLGPRPIAIPATATIPGARPRPGRRRVVPARVRPHVRVDGRPGAAGRGHLRGGGEDFKVVFAVIGLGDVGGHGDEVEVRFANWWSLGLRAASGAV